MTIAKDLLIKIHQTIVFNTFEYFIVWLLLLIIFDIIQFGTTIQKDFKKSGEMLHNG